MSRMREDNKYQNTFLIKEDKNKLPCYWGNLTRAVQVKEMLKERARKGEPNKDFVICDSPDEFGVLTDFTRRPGLMGAMVQGYNCPLHLKAC